MNRQKLFDSSVDHAGHLLSRLSSIEQTEIPPDNDIASQSSEEIMEIVREYARITYRCNHPRSEKEEQLIDDILKMAESDGVLEFWLSETDHILGHLQGNLDEDARESYKDQYAVLREYLGEDYFDFAKPPKKPPLTKKQEIPCTKSPVPTNRTISKPSLQNKQYRKNNHRE
jgi:hypothetical protein